MRRRVVRRDCGLWDVPPLTMCRDLAVSSPEHGQRAWEAMAWIESFGIYDEKLARVMSILTTIKITSSTWFT